MLTDGAQPAAPTDTAPRRVVPGLLRNAAGPAPTAAGAVVVALLAALTSLRWIDTPSPTWTPILQAVVPFALYPAVIVLILAAHTRRRGVAVAAGAVAAVHLALAAPWWLPGGHAAGDAGDDPLVVLASNVQYGFSFPTSSCWSTRCVIGTSTCWC